MFKKAKNLTVGANSFLIFSILLFTYPSFGQEKYTGKKRYADCKWDFLSKQHSDCKITTDETFQISLNKEKSIISFVTQSTKTNFIVLKKEVDEDYGGLIYHTEQYIFSFDSKNKIIRAFYKIKGLKGTYVLVLYLD